MKLELTKRDILLLKLTSCVLIAFVMVRFGLMPSVTRLQERQLEGQLLEERIEAMQDSGATPVGGKPGRGAGAECRRLL